MGRMISKEYIGPDGDIGGEVIELWLVTFERADGSRYTKQIDGRFLSSNKKDERPSQ